jgi:hypothetical protein
VKSSSIDGGGSAAVSTGKIEREKSPADRKSTLKNARFVIRDSRMANGERLSHQKINLDTQ